MLVKIDGTLGFVHVEEWAERHRRDGHHPQPAPTNENPEQWECECGGVWRILTAKQIAIKFAHLGHRDTPRAKLDEHVKEFWAEELLSQQIRERKLCGIPPLRITDRYARRRPGT